MNIIKNFGATMVVASIVGATFLSPVMASPKFSDVPMDHTFYVYIESLAGDGVVGGYSDGTFRPDESVSRGAMAKFVTNGLGFKTNTACEKFPDVDESNVFYDYIMTLKCEGVVGGFSDGEFKSDKNVTRAETMTFLIKGAREIKNDKNFLEATGGDPFPDVEENNPHYDAILSSRDHNIVSGYPDGDFKPDEQVNRGAISKMVDNTRKKLIDEVIIPINPIDPKLLVIDEDTYKFYYPEAYQKTDIGAPIEHMYSSTEVNSVGGSDNINIVTYNKSGEEEIKDQSDCVEIESTLLSLIPNASIKESNGINYDYGYICEIALEFEVGDTTAIVEDLFIGYDDGDPSTPNIYEVAITYSIESDQEEIDLLRSAQDAFEIK